MIRPKKLPRDPNERAFRIVQLLTGQVEPTPEEIGPESEFVEHGAKGGKARAKSLTAKKRSEIAKKAAVSRWSAPRTKDK